jgi:NAD(P)-dependent dehydrogenase (short-subunit alcohol dehydrogenase family)
MVAATVERWGGLHLTYLNAGVAKLSSVLGGEIEIWDRVVAINLSGVYYGMHSASKAIVESGGGSIVATASIAGMTGGRGMPSYFATKHGVIGLVRAAAAELAQHGVRVNAVCPGVIDTPILGSNYGNEDVTTSILGQGHLLGRCGRPEEIARGVSFLLSEQASCVSAAAWPVDAGMTGAPGGPARPELDELMQSVQGQFSAGSKAF